MMKATYTRKGDEIEIVAATALERDEVVALPSGGVGVAIDDTPAGGAAHLHVVGVFAMPKATTEAVTPGTLLYFDEGNGVVTATKGELTTVAGIAAAPAGAAASLVDVRLNNPA